MKFIIRILAIGALTYFISPFTEWWFGMIAAFFIGFLLPSSALNAFIAGFLGVGLVWLGHSWSLDVSNASSFSTKVSEILKMGDSFIVVISTGVVGGIAGGFASITGSNFRNLFAKEKKKGFYS